MAIVEAASCGLQVVSTKVGGIPEVLPSELIILTEPNIESVLNGLLQAIRRQLIHRGLCTTNGNSITAEDTSKKNGIVSAALSNGVTNNGVNNYKTKKKTKHKRNNSYNGLSNSNVVRNDENDKVLCPFECNEIVKNLYNWENVAKRTERVYCRVLKETDPSFGDKLNNYGRACVPFMLVVTFCYLVLKLLQWLVPLDSIDIARDNQNWSSTSKKKINFKNISRQKGYHKA